MLKRLKFRLVGFFYFLGGIARLGIFLSFLLLLRLFPFILDSSVGEAYMIDLTSRRFAIG